MKKCAQNKIHTSLRRVLAAMLAFVLALNLLAPNAVMAKSTEAESPLTTKELNTIAEINSYLGLASQKTASGKETLEINGSAYNEDFYWDALDKDDRVPFDGPISYARYLIQAWNNPDSIKSNDYLKVDADESLTGQEAVKLVWDTYLYDIYDPTDKLTGKGTTEVKTNNPVDFGDSTLSYYKDDGTDFHETTLTTGDNLIKNLTYDYLENGVDYSAFMGNIDKTAKKIGEREYQIDLSAQAQAKVKGAVAMVVNVQTSWQLFDMEHANATKQTLPSMEVGAVANNTKIVSLYQIKRALLRFNDYMQENYPGNNLALDVITFGHNGTYSMINGTITYTQVKDKNKTETKTGVQYLSNDYDTIRSGLIGWDIFGNCEHNHYKSDLLSKIGQTIQYDVAGWTDVNGLDISDKVSKVLVNIGGGTEDSSGNNGYGLELPWKDFGSYNSVYAIRTNEGTSISTSGLISWLDYSKNNTGEPFKDGTGTNFTKKYVATDEDALFNTLVTIAEKEMSENSISTTSATDAYVENVKLQDTVSREFTLDESSIQAIVKDASGNVISTVAVDPATDANIQITHNADGTTGISYAYGQKVYSGQTVELVFNVTANDDFIGSNNVKTNVGTPTGSYTHVNETTGAQTEYKINSTATPEVNVPVSFDVTDGKSAIISIGETINLKTLSEGIAADAEDRVDNYSQTNGTLVYSYTLPDGTVVDLGSVKVTNGSIGDQKFSDRSYEFIGTVPGTNNIQLNVKFVPDTMVDNGNYYEDTATKAPAEALEKSGNMVVKVLNTVDNANTTLRIRKIWDGVTEENQTPISFTLYKTVNGVKSAVGSYFIAADDYVTVNGEQIGWTIDIENLPTVEQVGDSYVEVTYSIAEDKDFAKKYTVSYLKDEDVDALYQVNGTVKFSPTDDGKIETTNSVIVIDYTVTHDGITESKTYTTSISDIIGGVKQEFKKNTEYSVTLPLFETRDSNPDYTFEVTDINYIRNKDASISDTKELPYKINQSVTSYISVTNAPVDLTNKNVIVNYKYADGTTGTATYKVGTDIKANKSGKFEAALPKDASKGTPLITSMYCVGGDINKFKEITSGYDKQVVNNNGSTTIHFTNAPEGLKDKWIYVNYVYTDSTTGEQTTGVLTQKVTDKVDKDKSGNVTVTFPENASKGTFTITDLYYTDQQITKFPAGSYTSKYVNECTLTVTATPTEKLEDKKYLADVVIKVDGKEINVPVTKTHEANKEFTLYTTTKTVSSPSDTFNVKVIKSEYQTVKGDLKAGTIKSTSSQVIASSSTTTKVLAISNSPAGFTIVHVPVINVDPDTGEDIIDTANIVTNTVLLDEAHYDSDTKQYTYDITTADGYDRNGNHLLYAGQYYDATLETPLGITSLIDGVANASDVDADGNKVEVPTAAHPVAGQTYYIKEISRAYLRPSAIWTSWYRTKNGNQFGTQVVDFLMLTAVDNKNYAEVGFAYSDIKTTKDGTTTNDADTTIHTAELTKTVHLDIPYDGLPLDGKTDSTYATTDLYYNYAKDGDLVGYLASCNVPIILPYTWDKTTGLSDPDTNAPDYAEFTGHPYYNTYDGVHVTGDTLTFMVYKTGEVDGYPVSYVTHRLANDTGNSNVTVTILKP